MHSDSKKRRSFLVLLFAAGDLRRCRGKRGKENGRKYGAGKTYETKQTGRYENKESARRDQTGDA